jgi:hypothetical protein
MRVAFFIAHPSQYYVFRDVMMKIKNKHDVILVYFEKDIIKDIIDNDNIKIESHFIKSANKSTPFKAAVNLIKKESHLFKLVKSHKIDLIVGTSIVIAHVAKLAGVKASPT